VISSAGVALHGVMERWPPLKLKRRIMMMDSTIDVSLDQQQRDGRHLPSAGGGGGGGHS